MELLAGDRAELEELATAEGLVELVIPRGGEGLKEALKAVATVPVLYAAGGNCHVYVHSEADLEMAQRIAYNAKVDRPGVCNAAETLLVDAAVAEDFLPGTLAELADAGVELVGDERVRAAAGGTPVGEATDADWDTEYHGMKMAVGVVDSLDEAIAHVNGHGTGHTEAIVTGSGEAARSSPTASTRRWCSSTRRPATPTATCSGWAPRSATRPRSFTRAARSACAS